MTTLLTDLEAEPVGEQEGAAAATWYAFRHNPMGLAASVLMLVLVLVGVGAPLIATYPNGFSAAVLQARRCSTCSGQTTSGGTSSRRSSGEPGSR